MERNDLMLYICNHGRTTALAGRWFIRVKSKKKNPYAADTLHLIMFALKFFVKKKKKKVGGGHISS